MTKNIKSLNLHYLLALRDHANRDLSSACLQFGTSREFAQKICDLPLDDIKRLADTTSLLFQPTVSTQALDHLAALPESVRPAFLELLSG